MITQVTYARLYNLGNYENERFEVAVTVEDGDVTGAFELARATVEAERHAAVEDRKQQEAARIYRQRAARNDDPPF